MFSLALTEAVHLERNVAEWCRHKRVGGATVARAEGPPSWTSSVRSRRISADDGPGGLYATFRDTTCPLGVIGSIVGMRDTLATHISRTVDGGEFGTIKRAQFKG